VQPHEHAGVEDQGSSWIGASFNLTSSILGAGCIGLGGAIADSGGLISFLAILVFAILSKYSFDLVVDLALESPPHRGVSTYEDLGYLTYQNLGRRVVILSKGLYSFGCLVAYIVIVRDNAAEAISYFLYEVLNTQGGGTMQRILENREVVATFFSMTVMLPLCMLRDLTPLEQFSAFKISVLMMIVAIVIYLYVTSKETIQKQDSNFMDHWITIHGGVFRSLGTFVFAFAANHTIHLVFQSLRPNQRKHFGRTTAMGTALSTVISMSIGFFVYMTFWDHTTSSIFSLYPRSLWVEFCRGLLCISMLLTYPFPFLTTRELLVLSFVSQRKHNKEQMDGVELMASLSQQVSKQPRPQPSAILLPGSDRQLLPLYHICLTVLLWLVTLLLALKASSLGSVLNMTGCVTGTAISYILPAVFSYKLRGHTVLGTLLFSVGGLVGIIGTIYSFLAL
jgi:sodium-coupled neutral amino acid transporter 11